MLHYLIPKDEEDNDSDYHNTTRTQKGPFRRRMTDYSPEEIRTAIEAINSKKIT